MSGRRQQTAEAVHTAAADAARVAANSLRSLRNAEGYWPVSAPALSIAAREFSLDPQRLPVWMRAAVVARSILDVVDEQQPVQGFALKIGFLRRRAIQRAAEWLAANRAAFATPDVARALANGGTWMSRSGVDACPTTVSYEPVRDTAIAAFALGEAGPSTAYLSGKRHSGFASELYPDADTAAAVVLASGRPDNQWLLERQSADGGWAAFDSNTEPSAPDVTAHVLEAFTRSGLRQDRAVDYLLRTQEPDGSWSGAWAVNYVYGTFRVLRGLQAAGVSDREAPVLRGGEWLRSIQNADGGWGESCASYSEGTYVPAPSTPSQTAWAILGLLAGGDQTSLSVNSGIEYLVDTQLEDGTWAEEAATAAGVPRGSFWANPLYRISFPLLALSSYLKTRPEVANS